MRFLFTILTLFSSELFAQNYIAQWTSSFHDYYEIQQSTDNVNWITVGSIVGIDAESTYQYVVPGAGYFYRIKAGNVKSNPIYLEPIILPVRIADAFVNGGVLTWNVESEDNIDYYLIESSTDAINFKEIKRVIANGSSTYKINLK